MKKILTFISVFFFNLSLTAQTTVNDITASGFTTEFNSLSAKTRIVVILDPLCSACIGHSNDLRLQLFAQCDNPDLTGMIVWVKTPGFPSQKSHAINQANNWTDNRVLHYWNTPADDIPVEFGAATWTSCSYAWDIAMIYPAGAMWNPGNPTSPYYCIAKTLCCNPYNMINFRNQLINLGECNSATGINDNQDNAA